MTDAPTVPHSGETMRDPPLVLLLLVLLVASPKQEVRYGLFKSTAVSGPRMKGDWLVLVAPHKGRGLGGLLPDDGDVGRGA